MNAAHPAPAASRFIQAGGLRLHYLDYGTEGRRPMLCVHGGAANAHWFDFIAPNFNADYHVRSLDLRGHGDSAWSNATAYSCEYFAADLAEMVEKLDLRDFVLIGHSMGGTVSVAYAAMYPGRVSRLIAIESRPRTIEESLAKLRAFSAREGKTYSTSEEFVSGFRLRPGGNTTATPEVLRHTALSSIRQTPDGRWQPKFDRKLHARRETVDGFALWGQVGIPTLFVTAGLSNFITPEVLAAVKTRNPNVAVAEVPNSDHHVPLDNPSGLTQVVKRFLSS